MNGRNSMYRQPEDACATKSDTANVWKELAAQYHKMRMARARANGALTHEHDGANYLLMGLAGATGKVMTQAKRLFGRDVDGDAKAFADSLASVRIYVEQIARDAEIDLDHACTRHMQAVLARMDSK